MANSPVWYKTIDDPRLCEKAILILIWHIRMLSIEDIRNYLQDWFRFQQKDRIYNALCVMVAQGKLIRKGVCYELSPNIRVRCCQRTSHEHGMALRTTVLRNKWIIEKRI